MISRTRYYDSKFARWLSVDPLADKYPGWSPYNYTMNNPLRYVDPDGKEVKPKTKEDQRKWVETEMKLLKTELGTRSLKEINDLPYDVILTYEDLPATKSGEASNDFINYDDGTAKWNGAKVILDDQADNYKEVGTPVHELTHVLDAFAKPKEFQKQTRLLPGNSFEQHARQNANNAQNQYDEQKAKEAQEKN